MKFFKSLLLGLAFFIAVFIGGVLTWYFMQGPSHQGLIRSDFADKNFNLNEIVDISPLAEKPNIVFILADDLGYGDVGYNLQTVINTKNLD
ncbi:MAG: hypothetical protein H6602_11115, partial [Flavobacteriales bacterium]|nr:hypothetical protein [Flavobacteriales bacterium]